MMSTATHVTECWRLALSEDLSASLGRMPVANVTAWIIARFKSVPLVVLRAVLAEVLHTFDVASDLFTIQSLFAMDHGGPASALLTMVLLAFAVRVRARCADVLPRRVPRWPVPVCEAMAAWQRVGSWCLWPRRCLKPSS
jgi:hypothetical protein